MAKRFIDVDEALKLLRDRAEAESYLGLSNNLTKFAIAFIERQPTADAVEVVRCKDCKHSYFVKSCSKYECRKGCGILKYSNDFCSYGERRKDDVDK